LGVSRVVFRCPFSDVEEVDAGWIVAGVQYEVAIFKFPYEDGVHDPVSHV